MLVLYVYLYGEPFLCFDQITFLLHYSITMYISVMFSKKKGINSKTGK